MQLTVKTSIKPLLLCAEDVNISIHSAPNNFSRLLEVTRDNAGRIDIELRFWRKNRANLLTTKITTQLSFDCQRCLQQLQLNLFTTTDYLLVKSAPLDENVDYELLVLADDNLALHPLLEDELLLAVPHIIKHDDCDFPSFKQELTEQNEQRRENPFAVLAQLQN